MSLKLIYGAATSAKTQHLYKEIIERAEQHPEQNFILLVPEQASLTAQEDLVNMHPRHALSNIDILTFNRLAFRVFEQNGVESYDVIDELGKIMLLRLVVGRNENRLSVLRRGIHRIGMLSQLKSVISELVQYNISPEELRKSTEALESHKALQAKLQDIAFIYEEFMKVVHQKHELMEERPVRLAAEIKNWKQSNVTTIALDDFTGFTPPQYAVLEELLKHCPSVISTVTVGTGEDLSNHKDESDLFHMSAHMAERLKEMAIRNGIDFVDEWITEQLPCSETIAHIEQNLYRTIEKSFERDDAALKVVRANRSRDEIAYVLHEISKDVRKGYRYRDIAVISGGLSEDRHELEAQFGAAGISYFIDERRSISNNPLTLLVSSALNAVENNFDFDHVFAFAKNPLCLYHLRNLNDSAYYKPFERVCEAENLALARGYRGRNAYEKEWKSSSKQFDPERFPIINETKKAFSAGLLGFEKSYKEGRTAAEKIAAVRELLDHYEVEKGLISLANKVREDEPLLATEYESLFEVVDKLLLEFEQLLSEEEIPNDLFMEILLTGLMNLVMRHVPPTKDRVVIGDLKRTRLNHIKKLYVMRANEGILPEKHDGTGLINDHDREFLRETSLMLSDTAKEQAFNDRYYLYRLLTKPSESLCVSYCQNAKDGKGIFPSELIGRLRRLFPSATVVSADENVLNSVNSPYDAMETLAKALTDFKKQRRENLINGTPQNTDVDISEEARAIYHGLVRLPEKWQASLEQIFKGLYYFHQDENLSSVLTTGLYTDRLTGSVTLLETYATCPYRHFLNYGLALQEKEVYCVEPTDLGSMLHNSIEGFFRLSEGEGKRWHALSEEDHERILAAAIDEAVSNQRDAILEDSAKNQYLKTRIERIAERTLWTLKKQWDTGSFENTKTEIGFGENATLPPIHILLSGGQELVLQGRIDRLDTAEDNSRVYLKIIDYKSKAKTLDFTKVYYGLQLQLLLYMGAATNAEGVAAPGKQVLPVGLYYYGMDDPMLNGDRPSETTDEAWADAMKDKIYEELKMSGLTNSDPEIFSKIDRNLASDGKSTVIDGLRFVKKSGEYTGAVDTESMEALESFALNKSKELAESIMNGEIPVRPYRGKKEHGCNYCPYRGICGFDAQLDGYSELRCKEKTLADIVNPLEEGGKENG